jgi:hypothetical protein
MSRRFAPAIATVLAGLALSLASAAVAAPVATLARVKVKSGSVQLFHSDTGVSAREVVVEQACSVRLMSLQQVA